jgi:Protein of unknown function (DUF1460)
MPSTTPDQTQLAEGLNEAELVGILDDINGEGDLGKRLERISKRFLGRPYLEGSLGGAADVPEVLRITLEAFDCVTYLEVVLALACSGTLNEFVSTIRRIRYERGEIDWSRRNHYMTDWARNNEAEGFVANLTSGPETIEKSCTLDLIPGLPAKTAAFNYFPKESLSHVVELAQTGDLVFFVSTRSDLDVFHTGLLIKREAQMMLRHATRSVGAVIDQDLSEFVAKNEPAGVVLLRPVCQQ